MLNQVLIFAFAFLGGISRYWLSLNITWGIFPIATLLVNLIGAAFLPLWNGKISQINPIFKKLQEPIGTGFCGALTTFSTLMLDVYRLISTNHLGMAIFYLFLTIILGLILTTISATLVEEVA